MNKKNLMMKLQNLIFISLTIVITFLAAISCTNDFVNFLLPEKNKGDTENPVVANQPQDNPPQNNPTPYTPPPNNPSPENPPPNPPPVDPPPEPPSEPPPTPDNPKPVTITGLSAANKLFDGTTTATITGTATINGVVSGDVVTVVAGTADFADIKLGKGKTVTFSGWSLSGKNAENYTLSAQPESVKADIYLNAVEMVYVAGGTFILGKNHGTLDPADTAYKATDSWPTPEVTLSDFKIGKYEVTQRQYWAVMEKLPTLRYDNGLEYPIYNVNWYDAIVFCNKLSILEGLTPAYRINNSTNPSDWGEVPSTNSYGTTQLALYEKVQVVSGSNGYRLPTEAQWEYAAKGGNQKAPDWVGYMYSGSNIASEVGWYSATSPGPSSGKPGYTTHQVGLKKPNFLGIYDMSGNVFEWCWDFGEGNYQSGAQTDPTGKASGNERVIRGGSWFYEIFYLRSMNRRSSTPYTPQDHHGFRVARP